ncbi:MAG: 4Fe-4S dicluster domain-containing protein, partial [Vicinamibacterales bacterium]
MRADRRRLLKTLAATAAGATVAPRAEARARFRAPAQAVGMLYDATRCIGCKACMVACREANNLPLGQPGSLYDAPVDLSPSAATVVRLQRRNGQYSFIKSQCMHCVDPACASACMLGALHKRLPDGVVTYDPERCIGCRYCQIACPFNVPRFEWNVAFPRIIKCELCRQRLDGGDVPACVA